MAELYADGHGLEDPMLSPVYGDMRGFPPTLLTTGTPDLLLSDTVRVHRQLRRAGVEADLHVYEAQASLVDNVLIGTEERCQAMAELMPTATVCEDPMLSPVYGDMRGFPPTLLTTGTRDLLLSDTVRVHRQLRRAGVEADLHVYEAQAHGHRRTRAYIRDSPESREAFEEMARFFRKHLAQ